VFVVIIGHTYGMDEPSVFLTTSEVARQIGSSRQHVVNLCDRGALPFAFVGSHRRVLQSDLDSFRLRDDPQLHQHLRSLWLHQAVAGKMVVDPIGTLTIARGNLARHREIHRRAGHWIDQWEAILKDQGEVLKILSSLDRNAIELRANTPFAGVLSQDERANIIKNFQAWWNSRAKR
jgi:excisionase family DNA binding protein